MMRFGVKTFVSCLFGGILSYLVVGVGHTQNMSSDPNAVTMTVMPMALDVKAPKVSETITVRNGSRRPMQVQFRVFAWQKRDGKDVYTPTTDVVVTPPFVKIRPGDDGTVRVVRTAQSPVQGEESYRVFVDQMPSSRVRTNISGAKPGLSMILSQSIPVFFSSGGHRVAVDNMPAHVSPAPSSDVVTAQPEPNAAPASTTPAAATTTSSSLAFSIQSNGGRYNLTITNRGASRVRLSDVELLAGGKRVAYKKGSLGYALPGQSASFSFSGRGGGQPDRVRYTTEEGRFELPLR